VKCGYSGRVFNVSRGSTLVLSDGAARSSVSVVPTRGAIATSFRVEDRELLYLDESTLSDRAKNVRGGVPVLFPSPGRLEGDRFVRGAKRGAMRQHGFARELPWEVQGTGTTDAATVTLSLASNERTRAEYPWDFLFSLAFTLRGACLRLDATVANTGTDAMPFAFGIHPYFFVEDKRHARIATAATRAFDNVKKEIVPFRGFDLTAREVDLHLLDHGSTESSLTWKDGSRVVLRGSSELTRWVVWTVEEKPYVCLEPWTAPANALNTGESLLSVEPGASRTLWVEMTYQGAPA
jgi:galactose mutarotase-like enzyme